MGLMEVARKGLREWLKIEDAQPFTAQIQQLLTFEGNTFRNRMWYRGEAFELDQFFRYYSNTTRTFWGAKSTAGLEIRKLHSGLPQLIVNCLANITISDLNGFTVMTDGAEDTTQQEIWDGIASYNDTERLFQRAVKGALIVGDGAFKVSIDTDISPYPMVEFVSGERVEYSYHHNKVAEVAFKTNYAKDNQTYTLYERYGFGYVRYELFRGEKSVELSMLEQTAHLVDALFDQSLMLAVPFSIFESERYAGRGQSIYEGKSDSFDSLDEALSQWIDALRAGRSKTYIPESLLPRDPMTGGIKPPNAFDNRFIAIGDDNRETGANKVTVESPAIPSDSYVQTYITFLDLCLQGIISPSTLGIDVKKLDNAEAQREKEKATLYTRQSIVDALQKVIPDVVSTSINAYRIINRQSPIDIDAEVSFGEYANPSFEAQVETLSNPNTPMSIEAKVEELWGDNKAQEWKDEEVARIKAQQGLERTEMPGMGIDYGFGV